jgi:hypothetical protein
MAAELKSGFRMTDFKNPGTREPCGSALVWTREAW